VFELLYPMSQPVLVIMMLLTVRVGHIVECSILVEYHLELF
jgi:hypothetical protein